MPQAPLPLEHHIEIACDESGYEGEKLIGSTTAVFAHGSVRLDHATAADVRTLISTAQQKVKERFGHELHSEIGFIGEF